MGALVVSVVALGILGILELIFKFKRRKLQKQFFNTIENQKK